jgi:glutamine synthetase type III
MDQIQGKKERASGSSAKVLQRLNSTKSQAKVHRSVGKDTDGVITDQVKKSADSAKRVPLSGKALFGVLGKKAQRMKAMPLSMHLP